MSSIKRISPRRHLGRRRQPHRSRLRRPPPDGHQGPRQLPRGQPAPSRWPRTSRRPRSTSPSAWPRSTPAAPTATRTCAAPTSSTSRTTDHALRLHLVRRRGTDRRPDHRDVTKPVTFGSTSTACRLTRGATPRPASRPGPRSTARDWGLTWNAAIEGGSVLVSEDQGRPGRPVAQSRPDGWRLPVCRCSGRPTPGRSRSAGCRHQPA